MYQTMDFHSVEAVHGDWAYYQQSCALTFSLLLTGAVLFAKWLYWIFTICCMFCYVISGIPYDIAITENQILYVFRNYTVQIFHSRCLKKMVCRKQKFYFSITCFFWNWEECILCDLINDRYFK